MPEPFSLLRGWNVPLFFLFLPTYLPGMDRREREGGKQDAERERETIIARSFQIGISPRNQRCRTNEKTEVIRFQICFSLFQCSCASFQLLLHDHSNESPQDYLVAEPSGNFFSSGIRRFFTQKDTIFLDYKL
jgi:hypothetical protein